MIDAGAVRYELIALPPQGGQVRLSPLGLGWEEPPGELAVRLQAELRNVETDVGWQHQLVPLGGQLALYADWGQGETLIWRGTIFDWRLREREQRLGITAYDQLIQLQKSKDDRYYPAGTTARNIIVDLAQDWGIPLGTVEGPDVALAKQVFRARTVAEMIAEVLDQARQRGAGEWIVRARPTEDGAVIDVVQPGQNQPVYWLRQDESVLDVEDQQDIEELVTRVKIVGAEDGEGRAPVVATLDGRTEFGVLQEIVHEGQHDTPAAARQAADELLNERGQPRRRRRVEAPDLPFLRRGDRLRVEAGTLDGRYLVAGVSHDADSRTMTLEVEE